MLLWRSEKSRLRDGRTVEDAAAFAATRRPVMSTRSGRGEEEGGSEGPGTPSETLFETVVDSISDGVFAVDLQWRVTCFNRAAERTTGLEREAVLGRPCSEVLQANICKEACALRTTMETGRPIVNLPIHIRDASGNAVPLTISTAILRDAQGRIRGGVETFRDLRLVRKLLNEVESPGERDEIITQDPGFRSLLETVPTIAQSESTVLIEGESGTGKGLLARAVHRHSQRSDGPLVEVNCGALPEPLLESELFGYRAGAFTGATKDKRGRVTAARGGTLFLDEIGELPLAVQVKLLRLLQERLYEPLGDVRSLTADVRIVAATNRDLAELTGLNRFRRDLFYRINVIRLELPPLRERLADVPLLADDFLRHLSMTRGKVVRGLSQEALRLLLGYRYPGNVRELRNILEHGYVLTTGRTIGANDLPGWFLDSFPPGKARPHGNLQEAEARAIRESLARHGGSRTEAARTLGIHRSTLHRKMRRLGIEFPPGGGRS
jgi:PAS domain S-box-containing protein